MPISYDEVKDLHSQLEQRDQRRHAELRALRRYWQGDYWRDDDSRAGAASVANLFRDLKGQTDLGPDLKLVHNLLQEVCVKFQTFLSPVPMIRTFVDPPFSETRRVQATKKERVLYGTWGANRVSQRMAEIGWYLPLMGDCFPCIWPDFDKNVPRLIIRSPEIAHPVRSFDGDSLSQIVFRWECDERQLLREYPNYKPQADKPRYNPFAKRSEGSRKVEIIEYSDENEYAMWAGDQKIKGVVHDFGFNLFGQMGFIPVPGEPFNHGAVEQTVSLIEAGNVAHSLAMQAMFEGVFPTLVLTDPSKAPEQIVRGAGGVIPLNPGGKADYLTPPAQQLAFQSQFIEANADKVLEASGMPRVNFGQSPATNIVTGAAVDALQGAGSGSTVEMVQGTQIGPELVAWNEKALVMYQTLYRDTTVQLYGYAPQTQLDVKGRRFSLTFKGSEIVGSTRNEVVFQPHIGDHEKLVMMLQARGDKLVSRKYAREQIGVADNDAMVEEIMQEEVEEAVFAAFAAELQASPTPDTAAKVEAEVSGFIETGAAPHPLLQVPAGAAPPPQGAPAGQPAPPPAPAPGGGAGTPPSPGAGGTAPTLAQAVADFQAVQGIQGRVFLVGQIVEQGTADVVEVAVTDGADRDTLQKALPQYQLSFVSVSGEPEEAHVEVTPGKPARPAPAPQQ